jgi:nucleoside-diphosphate-sugar epimerase
MVSSMAAAGPARRGIPLTGSEAPQPVTGYGRSKLAAEGAVTASSLPWCILRPPMVYGPRDREVLKVFRLARLGVAPVFGDGSQELSAVHAGDLAEALVAAATTAASAGRIYYPCHPEIFTSAELVRAIARAMGRRVSILRIPDSVGRGLLRVTEGSARLVRQATILTVDKANEFFQPAWTGDPTPLTRETGWHAVHDLQSGLADTWRWYRSAGWL